LLPARISSLALVMAEQSVIFTILFVIAWVASRVNRRQLLLPWRGGAMPVVWGVAYSIALRILIVVVATTAVVFWLSVRLALNQGQPEHVNSGAFRPQIEHLINVKALTNDPVYFALMITVASFVLGGLREELWRAGMFAGIEALFPRLMVRRSGQAAAVLIVAGLFGLAHTPQGWAGVAVTALLGAGLGAIMMWHRSIWEAALAHGMFDATTFVFIYLAEKFFPHQLPGL
jgi:membrane protease YdiL (CAAX protease family)